MRKNEYLNIRERIMDMNQEARDVHGRFALLSSWVREVHYLREKVPTENILEPRTMILHRTISFGELVDLSRHVHFSVEETTRTESP